MAYSKVLESDIKLGVMTNSLPKKGKLVYEYNPFRNYRLQENKYYYNKLYYTLKELEDIYKIKPNKEIKEKGIAANNYWVNLKEEKLNPLPDIILYEKGQLIDFNTNELSFSLEHPVNITPQVSYDGSVNLILNDGINIPRLINSRFSATGKNTYEIIDRRGNNDTNIYDLGEQFDIDTSLYKRVTKIPKLEYKGTLPGGNLKVGNYYFYFKYADADGNETDFIAESGLVSIFIGFNSPRSITTGIKDENSTKLVKFNLSNIDSAYSYVTIYYSRSSADAGENSYTTYKKIDKKYVINNSQLANIIISGFEDEHDISAADINLQYNLVDAVETATVCLNMLFMANVHKPEIPYKELTELSLRFLPYLKEVNYNLDITPDYTINSVNLGYYNSEFIYNNTGYWGNELYRFGIVYILPNNELSPVFNIRGGINITTFKNISNNKVNDGQYHYFKLKNDQGEYIQIPVKEETGYITPPNSEEGQSSNTANFENAKGVVSFKPVLDTDKIYALDIRVDDEVILELKKYVKGYFFVRQKRIPTILGLGITIGIDDSANTPTIPTCNGILSNLSNNLDSSYVETNDINDINYISEGFLSRYLFKLKKKKSSIWGKVGKIFASVAIVVAAAASAVVTFGGSLPAIIPVAAGGIITAASAATLTTTISTVLIAAGTAAAVASGVVVAGAVDETIKAILRSTASKELRGRYTKIPKGFERAEQEGSRKVGGDFIDRIIIKDPTHNTVRALLCPDYSVNQAYYNQIFTGNSHILRTTITQGFNNLTGYNSNYFTNEGRHFYIPSYYDTKVLKSYNCKICGVPDNVKMIGLDDLKFRSRAGDAEEAFKYEQIGIEYTSEEDIKTNSDIIRGSFGSYLAISGYPNNPAETVDIMVPGYSPSNINEYIQIRVNDKSSYYAISDRISFEYLDKFLITPLSEIVSNQSRSDGYQYELYRGDCYLCQFTHRIIRNFNDPSAMYNDNIVDANTWKDNYDPENSEKYSNINLGDVNAVQLGMWVTFKVRSSNNLNIRTLDSSEINEVAMTGHPKGYYPYLPMSTEGSYKTEDSLIYNKGFNKNFSDKWNFELPNIPYIKNWFGTRIMYSDIHINDAFKNGFRTFQGLHYKDYTREYGEIVKLITLNSNLLCVFEHGIALIPVNERAVAGEGLGGNIFINTSNVLPDNPKIISDMYGSQWADSVLKVPGKTGNNILYVYGVDTIAKKIWRTDGNTLTCISDLKVQEFLNNNITLGERELTPKIGIRNVKTMYNAYKLDVLFTFYDNTYGHEELVWNLCWNEILQKFITFYSWVPSFMENINNIPFSFNRDTSKWIAKLGTSHTDNSFADGITLSNVIINNNGGLPKNNIIHYMKNGVLNTKVLNAQEIPRGFVGVLSLSNRILPSDSINYKLDFSLLRDSYGNRNKFNIESINIDELSLLCLVLCPTDEQGNHKWPSLDISENDKLYQARLDKIEKDLISSLCSEFYYRNNKNNNYPDTDENKIKMQVPNNYPIFIDKTGKRPTLPNIEQINPDKLVTLLNIKVDIKIIDKNGESLNEDFYNIKAGYESGTNLINMGLYESTIAVIPEWNMQFLTTDFWKHGQSGIIDIADEIKPTYWYGLQHPFEFECIVVNDPSTHKIFTNLELIANKAKPESFHYEIIGECYDFAKDKPNMYFRLEALKALWQYNGADITYNRNFLLTKLLLLNKSADLIHTYYDRLDSINTIYDDYIHVNDVENSYYKASGRDYNLNHLSGSEIVYYPNRLEYRINTHAKAISLDDISLDDARSIIEANCKYLEDRWNITINPILICYKNEYNNLKSKDDFKPKNSTWAKSYNGDELLPTLTIYNSPIPKCILKYGKIDLPQSLDDALGNALYQLYDLTNFNKGISNSPLDTTSWLNNKRFDEVGDSNNRKELDLKDKFLKVRIRYSGEELAVIDFLNTIYRISYA